MKRLSILILAILAIAPAILSTGESAAGALRRPSQAGRGENQDSVRALRASAARSTPAESRPGPGCSGASTRAGGGGAIQAGLVPRRHWRLAYASRRLPGGFEVVDRRRRAARERAAPDERATQPCGALAPFLPRGRWVLFTDCAGDDCDGGISAVRVDGTHQHAVTPNSGTSFNDGSLSSDGARFAYQRWHEGGVTSAIYVARADGSGERRVTRRGSWPSRRSGDRTDDGPPSPAISTATVRSGLSTRSRRTAPMSCGSPIRRSRARTRGPAMPAGGDRLVLESDRAYPDGCCHSLFIVDADGTGLTAVPLPWDAYDPSWGPDLRSREACRAPRRRRLGQPPPDPPSARACRWPSAEGFA